MNREESVFVLDFLSQMEQVNSWCGETHLQKSIYLFQSLKHPTNEYFDFVMYKHGPYSFDLHNCLGEMESRLLLRREPTPPYGARLKLTPSGTRWLARQVRNSSEDQAAMSKIASRFSVKNVSELESLATAVWVLRTTYAADESRAAEHFKCLKPYISESVIENSIREMKAWLDES